MDTVCYFNIPNELWKAETFAQTVSRGTPAQFSRIVHYTAGRDSFRHVVAQNPFLRSSTHRLCQKLTYKVHSWRSRKVYNSLAGDCKERPPGWFRASGP
jgi:hypothetical protein